LGIGSLAGEIMTMAPMAWLKIKKSPAMRRLKNF
jgi:hypothetical protein